MSEHAEDITATLAAAVDGLLYPSESDEPFQPFTWHVRTGETAQQAIERHAEGKQPIVEQSVDEFFGDLADSDDADRYAKLRVVLAGRLAKLAVFRVGTIRVDVYLIGRVDDRWAGVKTVSVET